MIDENIFEILLVLNLGSYVWLIMFFAFNGIGIPMIKFSIAKWIFTIIVCSFQLIQVALANHNWIASLFLLAIGGKLAIADLMYFPDELENSHLKKASVISGIMILTGLIAAWII